MDSEFGFELLVCQWAEHHWPPEDEDRLVIVARQLGTKRRRWDTIVIECNPEGLTARAHFGENHLDPDLLYVVRHAPADWSWYRDALPDPGYPWRYVRRAVHRAADRGIIETRRSGNRVHLRRKWAYPGWVDRIIAIENKPDLDASAARELRPQVERDVALSLADEVWVATAATDESVEPVLLEDIPIEAGILTITPGARGGDIADVAWYPRQLPADAPGTRIIDRPSDGSRDAAAARVEYVDPDWKTTKRLEIAERAYGRGWRSYVDAMRPDCRHFLMKYATGFPRPYCTAKGCHQTPIGCSGSCSDFEPEPPGWRQRGWPIEGGPGATVKRVLDRQRRRQRPGPSSEDDGSR